MSLVQPYGGVLCFCACIHGGETTCSKDVVHARVCGEGWVRLT